MSTVASIASGYTSAGSLSTLLGSLGPSIADPSSATNGTGTSVQVALPSPQVLESMNNFQLEAAVQRVAMILYLRAHYEVPPSVTDVGGGIFNVRV